MNRARVLAVLAAAAVIAASVAACGTPYNKPIKGGPVDQGTGSLAGARKFLEGRWTLVSFEVFPPGREPIALKGSGTLAYDEYGNLKVEIRTEPSVGDQLAAAGVPFKDGVLTEEGRAVVDMQNRTLTYVMRGDKPASAPFGPTAMNRPRYWQVEGNILTLTTKDDNGKPLSVGRWQKSS